MDSYTYNYRDQVYQISDGAAKLMSWNKTRATLELPNQVDGVPVRQIDEEAFYDCDALRDISFPAQMTDLPLPNLKRCGNLENIFVSPMHSEYCSSDGILYNKDKTVLLDCPAGRKKPVVIPEGVREIGEFAFLDCSDLRSLRLPSSLKIIGDYALSSCRRLRTLSMPSGVSQIGRNAFSYCEKLQYIGVPAGVEEPPNFADCDSLQWIGTAPDHPTLRSVDGVLFDREMKKLLRCPIGKSGVLHIPETVVEIDRDALTRCGMLSAIRVAPDNPCYCDENGVLMDINRTRLIYCPAGYSGELVIPDSIEDIDPNAFQTLERVALLEVNGESEYHKILYSALESIRVERGNVTFASKDGVLYSKDFQVLLRCPAGYQGVLRVSDGTRSIAENALAGCASLTEVILPDTLEYIGRFAMEHCFSLRKVTVPESVRHVGTDAFGSCPNLRHVYILGDDTELDQFGVFTSSRRVIVHVRDPQKWSQETDYRYVLFQALDDTFDTGAPDGK